MYTLIECGFSKDKPATYRELRRFRGVSATKAQVIIAEGLALPEEQDGLFGLQVRVANILHDQLGIHDRRSLQAAIESGALKADGLYRGKRIRNLGRTSMRVIFAWLGVEATGRLAASLPTIGELPALRRFVASIPPNELHLKLKLLRNSSDPEDRSAATVLARNFLGPRELSVLQAVK